MKKSQITLAIACTMAFSIASTSCSNSEKTKVTEETVLIEEEVPESEITDVWVIDEYQINDLPLTSKPLKSKKSVDKITTDASTDQSINSSNEQVEEVVVVEDEVEVEVVETASQPLNEGLVTEEEEMEADMMAIDYDIVQAEAIHQAFLAQEYEPIEEDVTEVIVPIDETQTVTSYNKRGKDVGEIQVVSSIETGEIEQVVFSKGKHTDVYNVELGLTGKEVRKLRREMKHLVKNGQVFLYTESSNVMYLMDDKVDSADQVLSEEITMDDVEEMTVDAIIWKDKKHHKKK